MASHTMRPVEVTAHVPASPDQVFAFISDTRNDPLWCLNVETVEQLEGDGVEVGARFRFHQHLDRPGGGRIEFDGEVEVLEVGDRWIMWRATDKFQERLIRLGVEADGDGSKVTQATTATFHRPPGIVRWVYPRLARRTFKEQFGELASHFGG